MRGSFEENLLPASPKSSASNRGQDDKKDEKVKALATTKKGNLKKKEDKISKKDFKKAKELPKPIKYGKKTYLKSTNVVIRFSDLRLTYLIGDIQLL